jgi:hypothetical protein
MSVECAVANLALEFVERLQSSSNAIVVSVIMDVECRVVGVWFEHFGVVIRSIGDVDDDWVIDEFSLAKGADPLMVAGRHCQEARETDAAVSAWEDDEVSDLFEADDTLGC